MTTERVLTRHWEVPNGHTLHAALNRGAYRAATKALAMRPDEVIAEVKRANLRGLGGAGFPTGVKWSFVPQDTAQPVFLVVNADESEPGTFKDRYLMERDPHLLFEGMIIAAHAIRSRKAYIYIRGEYIETTRKLEHALQEAYAHGAFGKRVLGTDAALEVVIHRGAGAYICGEETALLESLEGKKGFPRLKPPFPAVTGLFGCPTIINNVETLCCVPPIIERGGAWFAKLGVGRSGGTRLYSVSGHVRQPGVYEASHSITLRSLIYDQAGGIRAGHTLKAVVPGGISATMLTDREIDVPMEFDTLLKAGTMAGSAGVIVMDETTCMVRALYAATKFFADESCGQCSPCREGCGWLHKIVTRIAQGAGHPRDLDTLLAVAGNMAGRTICAFGDAAPAPVLSYLTKFRDEFEYHVREKRCDLREQETASPLPLAGRGRGEGVGVRHPSPLSSPPQGERSRTSAGSRPAPR